MVFALRDEFQSVQALKFQPPCLGMFITHTLIFSDFDTKG